MAWRAGLDLEPLDVCDRDDVPAERGAFAQTVDQLDAVWIANEAPGVVTRAERPEHPWPAGSDPFVPTRDGQPVAWTDSHGTSIDWIG